MMRNIKKKFKVTKNWVYLRGLKKCSRFLPQRKVDRLLNAYFAKFLFYYSLFFIKTLKFNFVYSFTSLTSNFSSASKSSIFFPDFSSYLNRFKNIFKYSAFFHLNFFFKYNNRIAFDKVSVYNRILVYNDFQKLPVYSWMPYDSFLKISVLNLFSFLNFVHKGLSEFNILNTHWLFLPVARKGFFTSFLRRNKYIYVNRFLKKTIYARPTKFLNRSGSFNHFFLKYFQFFLKFDEFIYFFFYFFFWWLKYFISISSLFLRSKFFLWLNFFYKNSALFSPNFFFRSNVVFDNIVLIRDHSLIKFNFFTKFFTLWRDIPLKFQQLNKNSFYIKEFFTTPVFFSIDSSFRSFSSLRAPRWFFNTTPSPLSYRRVNLSLKYSWS